MGVNEIQSGKHNNILFQRASFFRGIPMRMRTCIKPHANYELNRDLNSITFFQHYFSSCVFHRIASSIQFWRAVGDRALFAGSIAILCWIYHQFSEKKNKKTIFLKWMNIMMSLAYTFIVYYYSKRINLLYFTGVLLFISWFFFS